MGPNKWGIFLILTVTTGEGVGPAGGISPVVCMLKNGLLLRIKKHMKVKKFTTRLNFQDRVAKTTLN